MSGATAKDFPPFELDPHEVVKSHVLDALIPHVFGPSSPVHGLTMRPDVAFVLTQHEMLFPDMGVFQRNRLKSANQK